MCVNMSNFNPILASQPNTNSALTVAHLNVFVLEQHSLVCSLLRAIPEEERNLPMYNATPSGFQLF